MCFSLSQTAVSTVIAKRYDLCCDDSCHNMIRVRVREHHLITVLVQIYIGLYLNTFEEMIGSVDILRDFGSGQISELLMKLKFPILRH